MTYRSKYLINFDRLIKNGWTEVEILEYVPYLENLDSKSLRTLHDLCSIKMFTINENIDKEQAIAVLLNPADTPKDLLISAIRQIGLPL